MAEVLFYIPEPLDSQISVPAARLRLKFPDKVPVICDRSELDQEELRLLVPSRLSVREFVDDLVKEKRESMEKKNFD